MSKKLNLILMHTQPPARSMTSLAPSLKLASEPSLRSLMSNNALQQFSGREEVYL